MPLKIMMSAGEVSGDLHAAHLASELKGCMLFGMGGEKMRGAGVDIRVDTTDKSSIGIIEAIKHLPSQISALNKMKKLLKAEKPDALILIDAQGFNVPLAKRAKQLGIKTIYYIAPQEWLWGTLKGVQSLKKSIDLVISIFKKEQEINICEGLNSYYYGHPLLDIVKPKLSKEAFCRKFGLDNDKKIIALCPGSRGHEIRSLLPILIGTAKNLGDHQYILPVSMSKYAQQINELVARSGVNIKVIEGFNYDALAHADLAISKSGTIILESVILGTPVIMFYKLSRLTYYIGRKFMKINLPFYSMPNLLAGRMVVPEFVMERATAENLGAEALKILADPSQIKSSYKDVMRELGAPGAAKKAAEKIIEFVRV
jgi:lipid-A-disaccharide synthase